MAGYSTQDVPLMMSLTSNVDAGNGRLRLQGSTLAVGVLSFGWTLSGVNQTVTTKTKPKRQGNKEMEEFDNPMARTEPEDESATVNDQSINEEDVTDQQITEIKSIIEQLRTKGVSEEEIMAMLRDSSKW